GEDLVPREFVGKAERSVHDFLVVNQDQVVEPAAAREPHLRELVKLAHKAKRPRGRDLVDVIIGRSEFKMNSLYADRPRIIERVVDDEAIGRFYADELIAR